MLYGFRGIPKNHPKSALMQEKEEQKSALNSRGATLKRTMYNSSIKFKKRYYNLSS